MYAASCDVYLSEVQEHLTLIWFHDTTTGLNEKYDCVYMH